MGVMCSGCKKVWTALQVLWSTVYVTCGAAQLIAGIFFLISVPGFHLTANFWAGLWNLLIGITIGMVACLGQLSRRRQEVILYLAVSVLAVNCISLIVSEWGLHFTVLQEQLKAHPHHVLIHYACFVTRVATAVVIVVAFVDSQLSFCSMHLQPLSKVKEKKTKRTSHEQVSDIEYIIPRPKSSKPPPHYNAFSQRWVYDADNTTNSTSSGNHLETPYLKILENGVSQHHHRAVTSHQVIENPVVHVEEVSDDSTSNSDRKLCHMRSFSRSASPILLSASSSHISLDQTSPNNPQIYEYLEKLTEPSIYRSRLNTAVSSRDSGAEEGHYQAPLHHRVEGVSSPCSTEKVQYASLMKELQKAIVHKKEMSPKSHNSESDKTQSDSKNSSRQESSRSDCKSSDAEFSKELEAALQLIQDLESPNTADTLSDVKSPLEGARPLAVWRASDGSGSEKTLSAVGSLAEITSPIDGPPELFTFKPVIQGTANGKNIAGCGSTVVARYAESQSTSGYSSPTHPSSGPTPVWSTTSSLNGSSGDMSYSIHNAKTTTVISLHPLHQQQQSPIDDVPKPKIKSVTLVNITNGPDPPHCNTTIIQPKSSLSFAKCEMTSATPWSVKSLLRRKKSLPKLCPELEGAIIKSESLAYLSKIELLARHQRNKEIQREIEERVIQQLGTPRSESNC